METRQATHVGRDCSLPTAELYVVASARDAGWAAKLATLQKSDQYLALQRTHLFPQVGHCGIFLCKERFQPHLATIGRAVIFLEYVSFNPALQCCFVTPRFFQENNLDIEF